MRVGDNLSFMDLLHDATSATDALEYRDSSPIKIIRFGLNVYADALTSTGSLELQRATHNAAGTEASQVAVGGVSCDSGAVNEGGVVYAEPDEE